MNIITRVREWWKARCHQKSLDAHAISGPEIRRRLAVSAREAKVEEETRQRLRREFWERVYCETLLLGELSNVAGEVADASLKQWDGRWGASIDRQAVERAADEIEGRVRRGGC